MMKVAIAAGLGFVVLLALTGVVFAQPAAPTGLVVNTGVKNGTHWAFLNWDDNTENDLAGYHVYRSSASGSGYTKITVEVTNKSEFSNFLLDALTTYYYVVTAVNTAGEESRRSAEVSITTGSNEAAPAARGNTVGQRNEKWWQSYEQFLKDYKDPGKGSFEKQCVEANGTIIPWNDPTMQGGIPIGSNLSLWGIMYGVRGHKAYDFRHCIFKGATDFGWTWERGLTEPECYAPEGQECLQPPCYYQMSFSGLSYGMGPWGGTTGAEDMPVKIDDLKSFTVTHDITYVGKDDNPGQPSEHYARHSLIYDLFITSQKPQGEPIMQSITDEIIIMMNYNPGYTDHETCAEGGKRGEVMSEAIEKKAVFDGFYHYDYHSFSDHDVPAPGVICNYHQFRRVGGDVTGAEVPEKLDMAPFFVFLMEFYNRQSEQLWLGMVIIGSNIYDHTHGSVTFHSRPTFAIDYK